VCRFFKFRKRSRKAVAPRRDPEAYSDALLSGWVPPPDALAPASSLEAAERTKQDEDVLERFYRSQQ
jgi:hypothetical protein